MNRFSPSVACYCRQRAFATLALCRGLRDETGSALVELALMLAYLGVPLLFGIVYFGTLLFDNVEIVNAAHAGAEYAMRSSTFAEENTGIIAAAQNESSRLGSNLTVTPT